MNPNYYNSNFGITYEQLKKIKLQLQGRHELIKLMLFQHFLNDFCYVIKIHNTTNVLRMSRNCGWSLVINTINIIILFQTYNNKKVKCNKIC